MTPLPGFSDNTFQTRSDYARAACALVQPVAKYMSPQQARIKLPYSTGAGFSETAAQLEGFARPLWVIPHFLGAEDIQEFTAAISPQAWINGLKAGTDPTSPEYWGDLGDFDQKMVEMESIAYAILLRPEWFSSMNDEIARQNLIAWLVQINHRKMPQTNWLWFKVLVNLALYRVLGVSLSDVKKHIDDSLHALDELYLGQGWNSDGAWSDERKQADYYSGSFALQFAPLLFVRFAPDYDEARTERYKDQAKQFAEQYWRYFSATGAAIPFGRSLTYRFAFAAFWAAALVAQVDFPAPLNTPGVVKGLLSRHLRWWAKQEHIFNVDGTLHIGYTYPNMHIAENYTSPQSPYWCLKPFICLDLPEEHLFWQSKEQTYPLTSDNAGLDSIAMIWPPRHIMCNTPQHHFLLSSGQWTTKAFRAREAKYGKMAYSSAFGLSVPCGPLLEQMAADATISVSHEGEEDQWRVRWSPKEATQGEIRHLAEVLPTLISSWKPWKTDGTEIKTTLIPPTRTWPGWHFRIHEINHPGSRAVRVLDAGFAISAERRGEALITDVHMIKDLSPEGARPDEGWYSDNTSALVMSKHGASGVVDYSERHGHSSTEQGSSKGQYAIIIHADPNT
ncbi:hypothetical protein MBLNU13_g04207t1 [Cladosporium sp. NU13]